ncbi:hypothetical protein CLOSTMETH_01104 [[Clostridium] methylpentosum DSM 5476]|uniref:Uncharacterized protein n=1 Tax=[Clostridium] methylpentosum DSM 5476 TaxID=537013 RepID=C0EB87_9FIRM|nr:hypothetical protein CLOSTMETH_01104 [[Clostridium] methylpentosum DSM 5476]
MSFVYCLYTIDLSSLFYYSTRMRWLTQHVRVFLLKKQKSVARYRVENASSLLL